MEADTRRLLRGEYYRSTSYMRAAPAPTARALLVPAFPPSIAASSRARQLLREGDFSCNADRSVITDDSCHLHTLQEVFSLRCRPDFGINSALRCLSPPPEPERDVRCSSLADTRPWVSHPRDAGGSQPYCGAPSLSHVMLSLTSALARLASQNPAPTRSLTFWAYGTLTFRGVL